MDVAVRGTEELRRALRCRAKSMEVVSLRSKFEVDEESVPSWNMSPSGSLCQIKCLQRCIQSLPRKPGQSEASPGPEG